MHDDLGQRILKEALDLFQQYGFKRATMDQLAARLAISKKTLYQLYPSKDSLMRAVIAELADPWLSLAQRQVASAVPLPQALGELSGVIEDLWGKVSLAMLADMESMPGLWPLVVEKREAAVQVLLALLQNGQRQGLVRPDLDALLLIRILISTLNTFGTPRALAQFGLTPPEFAQQVMTVFFEGVRVQAQPSSEPAAAMAVPA